MFKSYEDRRNQTSLKYLLDKYRDELIKEDNQRRIALKAIACEFCFSFNNCDKCKHM